MKRSVIVIALATLALLVPQSAWGISYGRPDSEHRNVGSFVALVTNPDTGTAELQQLCTGTLVSRTVVVSASHCFAGLPASFGQVSFTLDDVIDADRDGIVDPGTHLLTGHAVVNPLFGSGGGDDPHDVAVFLLDTPVSGVPPAQLPRAGLLDDRSVRSETFVAVGYGAVRDSNRTAAQAISPGWRREMATQTVNSVTKAWVTFSMNLAVGNGGTCYGDSGGPHFLGNVTVAVTVTGDAQCKATDKDYRLDTPEARAFLSQYVAVP